MEGSMTVRVERDGVQSEVIENVSSVEPFENVVQIRTDTTTVYLPWRRVDRLQVQKGASDE